MQRIELYDAAVSRVASHFQEKLGASCQDRSLWEAVKQAYSQQILGYADNAFFKTFFSSVTRRVFDTIGVDHAIEFAASDVVLPEQLLRHSDVRIYQNRGALDYLIDQVLADFSFSVPYRDRDRSITFIAAEVDAYHQVHGLQREIDTVEMLVPVFYRSTRAYLMGRLGGDDWVAPLVIALKNTDEGIVVDAVILVRNDVSTLFGFMRSYFHVDLDRVGATVGFLQRMMPHKPLDEIYTVLGRAKQGKTERYRLFFRHLQHSNDQFVRARGVKGMVMEVFTLPSYEVVFKVIRDRFDYPKTVSRDEVMRKYELVFKRDRAGRLVDAQEFRRLRFPLSRFESSLLHDLLSECTDTCYVDQGDLVVEHAYIERRLVPLNIYMAGADVAAARSAVIDYGQAIRDLALSNIFAGDLLLKNFGVAQNGRVIFYDYDELCLVTDCNFRHLPAAEDIVDEMRPGAWFYVGPNDIFPEQFIDFLGFKQDMKEAFLENHSELLTAEYWIQLKKRLADGETFEVLPYPARNWTEHKGLALVPAHRRDR